MIIDTSALVAMVAREPGYERLTRAVVDQPVSMSAVSVLEARVVLAARRFDVAPDLLDALFIKLRLTTLDFTNDHVDAAAAAYRRYGKGNHPARLNMGDCAAYATAKLAGEPLLYVGDDFTQTDVESAIPG
ncbi:MAG: type II toxin-antitoxin system VapC family toxin [Homoserinimonas sp.]